MSISKRKKTLNGRSASIQNSVSASSETAASVWMPMRTPLRKITKATTGSIRSTKSTACSGAARSSTRTCVSFATSRLASPAISTSRTVSITAQTSGVYRSATSLSSSARTKTRNRIPTAPCSNSLTFCRESLPRLLANDGFLLLGIDASDVALLVEDTMLPVAFPGRSTALLTKPSGKAWPIATSISSISVTVYFSLPRDSKERITRCAKITPSPSLKPKRA
mmetsp:Transcript_45229/g.104881  ORF Transcript_45229/g.104881 Transcript_45229/m.104881 type:complete len:223 (-) Transcript_45229:618-1286(-)